MAIHCDDVPWEVRECDFPTHERARLACAAGTRRTEGLAWYPDSGKVALRGLSVCTRIEPVDYWDGEDGA